ncbi:MAG: chemotaxis protein CheW [Thermodesulfobacteriota bacterium]
MAETSVQAAGAGESQLVCFRLAEEEFGVDITQVREIVRLPAITHIPLTPDYVRGVANLRGAVLPVIDCRRRFGLPVMPATERTRVLVLDVSGMIAGMVVDGVSEVMRVPQGAVDPPPPATQGGITGDFLAGVIKLDTGRRLVLLIRPEEVLAVEAGTAEGTASRPAALAHGSGRPAAATAKVAERQLVSFAVADEEYAFDIGVVKEILRHGEITALPGAPPAVRGLVTVREQLLPILDLRILLGLAPADGDEQRILVVEGDGPSMGLMVDRVKEVLRVPLDEIQAVDDLAMRTSELDAVARLDDGRRLILILDVNRLAGIEAVGELMEDTAPAAGETAGPTRGADLSEEQLVTFVVGGEEYGIRITQIREINRLGQVTRLPKAPAFLAGVTNLRGQVIPLIDLRTWFDLADRSVSDRTRIIIVDLDGQRTGFIVDQVNEVLRIPGAQIEATPALLETRVDREQRAFITGIGKLDAGKRMVLILDVSRMLTAGEQQALAALSAASSAAPASPMTAKPKPARKSGAKKTRARAEDAMAIDD